MQIGQLGASSHEDVCLRERAARAPNALEAGKEKTEKVADRGFQILAAVCCLIAIAACPPLGIVSIGLTVGYAICAVSTALAVIYVAASHYFAAMPIEAEALLALRKHLSKAEANLVQAQEGRRECRKELNQGLAEAEGRGISPAEIVVEKKHCKAVLEAMYGGKVKRYESAVNYWKQMISELPQKKSELSPEDFKQHISDLMDQVLLEEEAIKITHKVRPPNDVTEDKPPTESRVSIHSDANVFVFSSSAGDYPRNFEKPRDLPGDVDREGPHASLHFYARGDEGLFPVRHTDGVPQGEERLTNQMPKGSEPVRLRKPAPQRKPQTTGRRGLPHIGWAPEPLTPVPTVDRAIAVEVKKPLKGILKPPRPSAAASVDSDS